jgi:hypothetical protein
MHRLRRAPLCALLLALVLPAPAAAADWRPATYASPEGQHADFAALGAAGDGSLTSIWFGSDDDVEKALMSASRPAGGPWGASTPLSIQAEADIWPGAAVSLAPQVAVNAAGDAVAVWIVRNIDLGDRYHVKAAYRPAGEAWGDVETVEFNGRGRLQAGIADDGSAWIGWATQLSDPVRYAVKTARISPAGVFADAQTAAEGGVFEVKLFDLAVDAASGAAALVVGWAATSEHRPEQIRMTRHGAAADATWAAPAPITDFPSAPAYDGLGDFEPQAAFETDGDLRVAWLRSADEGGSVHSMLLPPGSSRTTEEEVAALDAVDFHAVSGLELATNGADTVLAWAADEFGPQGADLRTAERAAGATGWTVRDAATGLSWPSQNHEMVNPVAAVGPAGDTVVAWVAPHDETVPWNEQRLVPWSVQRPAGEAWTPAARLPVPAEDQESGFPRVAVGADGTLHAVWNEYLADSMRVAYTTTEPLPPDTATPDVTITTPAIGQRFVRGAEVDADYACTDETALASCIGTVPDGGRLDTSTVGQHAFTVVATDAAGHQTSRTHGYVVDAPADSGAGTPAGDQPGGTTSAPVVPQPPQSYHEIKPRTSTPPQKTSTQLAQLKFDTPAVGAVKAAPAKVKGSALLGGKVNLPIKPLTPNVDVRGGFVVAGGSANLISDNGLGLISDNGLGLLGAAGGNLLGPAGGNLIGPAGGNLLGAAGGNLLGAAGGNLARAAAKRKPKLTVLAKGAKFFPTPKAGTLRLKVGKAGRAALRRAFRKRGKQTLKVTYVVGFTERGSGLPTVVTARRITIRE